MKLHWKIAGCGGLLLSGLLLVNPVTVRAQDSPYGSSEYGGGWSTSLEVSTSIGNDIINSEMGLRNAGVKGKSAVAAPAKTRAVSLTYVPTAAVKAQTVQGYVSRLKTKNPAAAQAVATNFGPGKYDYGQVYRGLTKAYGLRENDAADAMASFMILGYMIVNNVQDGQAITVPMVQGVRAQFAPKLAVNPKLTAPGVPAQLGEEMKLLFVVVQGGWQAALKEKTLPAYQQGIGAMFKNQYGMDMTLFKLTDQGFAKR